MDAMKASRKLVKYVPKKDGKKWTTRVTKPHGGLHRQEEFKKGIKMLERCAHEFRNPRLFHIVFTGADVEAYQLALVRFCRVLRAEGIRYSYKAARENDSEKGEHFHVMIVLEAINRTHRFITPQSDCALRKAVQHTRSAYPTLDCSVIRPFKGRGMPFLQFNQSNMEKFDNAAEWMSYIYKARSKPDTGTVYFSDRQERIDEPAAR